MESTFPSLTVGAERLVPRGAFAEAQAAFLHPDPADVRALVDRCAATSTGIVAHFYMDAELQGALVAAGPPHTFIADSLQMADAAVKMAEAGKQHIVVLGVDFMSENVRAVLDAAGYAHVDVYRLADRVIGCSLAESAESPLYAAWLRERAQVPSTLHVVYINTSLLTKARAHAIVPTITCTSSNVVQTLLQAAAQIPEVSIAYGPDTYMGGNLHAMLAQFSALPDDAIRALHPAHDRRTIGALLDRFSYYGQGACIVHHLFGDDVVRRVEAEHADALLTAHLEVPGEMFALAARAQQAGRGVVGSTSNILAFITAAVDAAAGRAGPQHVPVVLGTEAGMVTSIVSQVQARLRQRGRDDVEVEIIFPVASEAVAAAPDSPLRIVPGVASGDGCSVAGGCATCPYMKMNTMDALHRVLAAIDARSRDPGAADPLAAWRPKVYAEPVDGRSAADLGSEPILHMRAFQRTGRLPDALVTDVRTRAPR
ncbi:MAG: quinolinate synthase NadA [Myxococcota bacterium]